jgi:hypothetical protein
MYLDPCLAPIVGVDDHVRLRGNYLIMIESTEKTKNFTTEDTESAETTEDTESAEILNLAFRKLIF